MINQMAYLLARNIVDMAQQYHVEVHNVSEVTVIDCGCKVNGGITVGLELANITMGTECKIALHADNGESIGFPSINVQTDWPTRACLGSQYAGWPLNHDGYFAMVSGPIRLLRLKEELLIKLGYSDESDCAVGVLESSSLPTSEVIDLIVDAVQKPRDKIILLIAPTTSLAGMIQVVSRSIETCMHKLYHLGFDTNCIVSAIGSAPLPPISPDVMQSIGWSNDAILLGGHVVLYVDTDDSSIETIGQQVPSSASSLYGQPFADILKEARDFYAIDPMLFSSAAVTFNNIRTGLSIQYGQTDFQRLVNIVRQS